MTPRRVARPSVLRGIPLDCHAVIEASAGTGKTFTLEHLVVELLLATDVTLDRVLVVSFTEKATLEIRARVRAKLEELVGGGPPPDAAQTAAGDFWTIDEGAQRKLERSLRAFDSVVVATIHAFCQRVLRENAFASGRLFAEQQVDGRDAFARAFREALRREVAPDPARARWLDAALRSGWSVGRVEEQLWKCLDSHGELRPQVDLGALDAAVAGFPLQAALQPGLLASLQRLGMKTQTASAVLKRLVGLAGAIEEGVAPGGTPGYVIRAEGLDLGYLAGALPPFASGPTPEAALCADALALARTTPSLLAALAHAVLPVVTAELARRKREGGQYDFDDMLTLVAGALGGERGRALAATMRERWRYVLIDEFQDTDETQWSIFRHAFFEDASVSPERRSSPRATPGPQSLLYLVGDPKQSIYRFRGADVQTYLRARDEVVAAGGARVTLDRNFRATPALVEATNAIFDADAECPVFSGDIRHEPASSGRPDRSLVDRAGRTLRPVHVFRSSAIDPRSLAAIGARIAEEIRAMCEPGGGFLFDGRPIRPSDVFVLTRNAREGRAVGAALREAGVPHAFYKQDGLFQTDEAREVRTLLSAIDDPGDRACRLAAWLTPFFGLPLSAIERVRDAGAAHPLVARLHAWKAMADARDFDRLFESIVVDSGVVRREIFFGDDERELTNYLHVLEILLEHGARARPTLRELLHALSGLIERTRLPLDLEGNVQRLESDRRSVQIMTIHKAKGLEAPVVFVVGGLSPPPPDEIHVYHDEGRRLAWVGRMQDQDIEALAKAEEREEEQRLMYVALTRAQGRLYLPYVALDPSDGKGKRPSGQPKPLRGPYQAVNRRLAEILRGEHPLFEVEDLEPGPSSASRTAARERGVPLEPPVLGVTRGRTGAAVSESSAFAGFRELRRAHAGEFVTSYTRIKGEESLSDRAWAGRAVAVEPKQGGPPGKGRTDEGRPTADEHPSREGGAGEHLTGARASGVFLHELLERVALESLAGASLSSFRERPEVTALFDEAMAAHGIDPAQRAHAEALVWTAFTTALELPGGGRIRGIASAARVAREMEFVFAIPGGFVRGSIDLAFELEVAAAAGTERVTYFVDWKSDSLPSYSEAAVARHVKARYELQGRLYAMAITKLLGCGSREEHEARFGGMLYCFLRGLGEGGRGVWSARPSWDEIRAWESSLAGIDGVGGRR